MNLWTKVRARWRVHDDHLAERELKRESAEPDLSIPDVGNVQGAAAAPGNTGLAPRPIDHKQEPPQEG